MKKYICSDILDETYFIDFGNTKFSKDHFITENEIFSLYKLNAENEAVAKKYCRTKGNYSTFFFKNIMTLSDSNFEDLILAIAKEIRCVMLHKKSDFSSVLIVGLGNSSITADSLGAQTVKNINVCGADKKTPLVFAVSTEVFSCTGIETADHVRGLVLAVLPDVVVVIDSLSARSGKRLYSTVQISDAGITPGSALGNVNVTISEETIGVPVISIGVPTVVSASTLICDALISAGINEFSEALKKVIDNEKDFFVTPGYCDMGIKCSSLLLSRAINIACREHILYDL